jgi:serine/threonine protein kinase
MKYISNKGKSFKAELDVMSRLHHKHLVNLVGYCDEFQAGFREMMLVYEYMPNGTVSDHIFSNRVKSQALCSWKARLKVALQAARGIEYLHKYADPAVIHRDIKSSNILLDAKGSVRVSDFGLCFMFPESSEIEGEDEVKQVTAKAAGTVGYMDPEYYHHHNLTTKSDVYSFGVVLFELLTGKNCVYIRGTQSLHDYQILNKLDL